MKEKKIIHYKTRFAMTMIIGFIFLVLFSLLGMRFGAAPTSFHEIFAELQAGEGLVIDLRLPRVVLAILIGVNMAVSGFILQSITRNPLAAPDIVGITAGGGLAAVIMILTMSNFPPIYMPIFSFIGAVIASFLVYLFAYRNGIDPVRLALSGVAISAGIHAIIKFLVVKYALSASQALVWLKGSLYARSWAHVEILWPWTLAGLVIALLFFKQINLLSFNDDTVKGLGLAVDRTRLFLIILAVALAASSVAVAGTIGFVGLVIPHAARILVGPDSRLAIPTAALLGAVLVTMSDLLGRVVLPPLEIPVGIVTSVIGAPYFLYLLLWRKKA
ncbi:iron ABC transporter permease [Bacillus sp. 03113]|uniref:FecCD family ABC transporter permease n=1 Tax=Bacillus sp. 03113 TaxID=2578211 RepID=UPI0011443719|nr:iron ABC transporter permease [Bacillus sp. 03113]